MNGILISKDKAINSGLIWKRNGSCYLAWQCQSAAAKHAVLAWLRENGTDCRIIQKSGRLRGELERVFPSPPHPILPESGGHLHPAAAPLRPSSPWPLLGVVGLSSHMDCCRTTCHSSASSLVPPAACPCGFCLSDFSNTLNILLPWSKLVSSSLLTSHMIQPQLLPLTYEDHHGCLCLPVKPYLPLFRSLSFFLWSMELLVAPFTCRFHTSAQLLSSVKNSLILPANLGSLPLCSDSTLYVAS